jgi:hypothetical protein
MQAMTGISTPTYYQEKITLPTKEKLKPETGNPLFSRTGKINSGKRR